MSDNVLPFKPLREMATPFHGFCLIDGPVEGTFAVRYAPVFLRAVVARDSGILDVLDERTDTPNENEEVYVYKLLKGSGAHMHLNFHVDVQFDEEGEHIHPDTGFYASGLYYWMPEVDGELLRDNRTWEQWVFQAWQELRA